MVSMKEIAKRCNVSVATVSKALNGYLDIGEETRNLVTRTASEMGYLPNSSARALKTKRTYNLGVLFEDDARNGLTQDYFNHILESFKNQAQEKGYDITFASGKIANQKMTYYEHFKYRGVDGVMVACVNFFAEEVQELIRSDIPIVTIDHIYNGKIGVVSNNIEGIEKLFNYVVENGHSKIAYIHGQNELTVTKSRLTGFYRMAQKFNIEVPEEYVVESAYRDAKKSAEATGKLLSLPEPPTCILYPDDYAAIGGINTIREMGLRIPEDISIVGYDGIMVSRILEPKLTTLWQNTEEIGKLAAEKLIDLIENPKTALIDRFTVGGALIKGASVKKIK